MLNLAIIFHMHQPFYKNLLTQETQLPWVRLHGVKDYSDMVLLLEKFPEIKLTFNLVPSLLEQVEDYNNSTVKDKFLELSFKPAKDLNAQDKEFIIKNFFSINKDKVIATFPRYYELYFKANAKREFEEKDYLDLQVLFNLAWIDPLFRQNIPQLQNLMYKARFFSEEDKQTVLHKHLEILKGTIPVYKKALESKQIEVIISPYYHPILPLLCNTNIAKEANPKTLLPEVQFAYPQDAKAQIMDAVSFYKARFGNTLSGMWPSEEAVSEHILPYLIEAGIQWIVADEAILFRSLRYKKRNTKILYQPHLLRREGGDLNIVFRDRNLSDLIGFSYHGWKAEDAVADFMRHLENINTAFKGKDILVTVAMDGENAWEYFSNDGSDFLGLLYQRLSESKIIKTTTLKEYLKQFPSKKKIRRLAAGSWIYGEFGKWIGNPKKVRAWELLALARKELESKSSSLDEKTCALAWKQIYICEGSDWFWWYGEDPTGDFDLLFRMHLSNFYQLIKQDVPEYLKKPL